MAPSITSLRAPEDTAVSVDVPLSVVLHTMSKTLSEIRDVSVDATSGSQVRELSKKKAIPMFNGKYIFIHG